MQKQPKTYNQEAPMPQPFGMPHGNMPPKGKPGTIGKVTSGITAKINQPLLKEALKKRLMGIKRGA